MSVFEQKVWILADRGINEKIALDSWEKIVVQLIDGIKDGRRCDAICRALGDVDVILKDNFPYESGDKNELHDLIIRWEVFSFIIFYESIHCVVRIWP